MLVELAIRDLALIEEASLSFGSGLNVITGETGAGKSLLIDALELLLGQRARAGLVRRGATRARVEGRFLLALEGYGALVGEWLREHLAETLEDLEGEDGDGVASGDLELILTRTLSRDGRSRAHVNHRPVTQRVLRELASRLVEIHGQNDHQKLFDAGEQLRLLDTFAELDDALAGYRERRASWLELARHLEDFEAGEAERLQRLDLLRYQAGELSEVGADLAEREALVAERALLRHAGEIGETLGATLAELSDSDEAALDAVRRAERRLEQWAEDIPALAAPCAAAREAAAQLEEVVGGLTSFLDGLEVDPARLEEVEERLRRLEALERKHRTDAAGLAARQAEIENELATLEGEVLGREELEGRERVARESLEESARRLTAGRERARGRLEKAVVKGLARLGLERASFRVELVERGAEASGAGARGQRGDGVDAAARRFGRDGTHGVEFLLAANPGEPHQPLRKVASGGEVARIMLALRGALAVRQSTPTLVFDEVDSGVGGRLGPRVAEQLGALGKHHQILCVTHLPAIAARATRHLRVEKGVRGGRTRTQVTHVVADARVDEIADMIAGGAAHETARAEARRLLGE